MSEGKIKVTIDHLGRPRIEAEGFVGTSCTQATAGIEKALAGNNGATATVLKPEYYETETQEQTLTQGW